MGKQCVLYRIQRRKPFRTWFAHINHVLPVKITFCTLFSLLQLLKRFKATYSEKPQTTLFSWETCTKQLDSVQKYVIDRFPQ